MTEANKSDPPLVFGSTDGLGADVPTRDRPTTEPGGCECLECGAIFIGAPWHTACGTCVAAYEAMRREEEQRAEWRAEMRRDAFGV
jgi:hypothetical protein